MEERINNNAAETANTAAAAETANTAAARVDRVIEAEEAFRDAAKIFSVAELFRLFGDPTRVGIMTVLYEKERCVCELSDLLGMTVSAISHQLRLLKQSGLVKYRREGKHLYYSLADSHVSTILAQGFEHVNE